LTRTLMISLLAVAALAGCGGGSGKTMSTTTGTPSTARSTGRDGPSPSVYVVKADAICRQALSETRALGKRLRNASPTESGVEFTTKYLVRPGLAIRERMGERMRALGLPAAGRDRYSAYLQLFDPIESVARERLRAGLAGDGAKAHDLEELLIDLGEEQKQAARRAGLRDCAKDFFTAFASGTSG
jgi:hypothetical protein